MTRPGLTPYDFHLLAEGTHGNLYDKLGAHVLREAGKPPDGHAVRRVGPQRRVGGGDRGLDRLATGETPAGAGGPDGGLAGVRARESGPGASTSTGSARASTGTRWTRPIRSPSPREHPPATASVIADLQVHTWGDQDWMANRRARNALDAPMSIYEVHLGSWRRDPGNPERLLSYGEMAPMLVEHVRRTGFTHVELMPVAEHPFYGIVGLPGDLVLRAQRPLRHARGLHDVHRDAAPGGHRRDPRLDAGPLSHRRARADLLRRHPPVRTRRSPSGHPRGVGQRRLQLRAQRGAQLPDVQRQLLAGPLPRRRPARGRRGLDVVPGLRAQAGRVDPQQVRRPRGSGRRSISCAPPTTASTASTPTCRPWPRSRPRGRWCRGRSTWAGWASV